jgi:hypothetical protein
VSQLVVRGMGSTTLVGRGMPAGTATPPVAPAVGVKMVSQLVVRGMGSGTLVGRGMSPRNVAPPSTYDPLIRRAVTAAVLADTTVTGMVGQNVFPTVLGQNAFPTVLITIVSNVREQQLDGPNGISRARVEFTAITTTHTQAEAIAEALRNMFDGFDSRTDGLLGGLATVIETTQQEESDAADVETGGPATEVYRTAFQVLFRYREPQPVRL